MNGNVIAKCIKTDDQTSGYLVLNSGYHPQKVLQSIVLFCSETGRRDVLQRYFLFPGISNETTLAVTFRHYYLTKAMQEQIINLLSLIFTASTYLQNERSLFAFSKIDSKQGNIISVSLDHIFGNNNKPLADAWHANFPLLDKEIIEDVLIALFAEQIKRWYQGNANAGNGMPSSHLLVSQGTRLLHIQNYFLLANCHELAHWQLHSVDAVYNQSNTSSTATTPTQTLLPSTVVNVPTTAPFQTDSSGDSNINEFNVDAFFADDIDTMTTPTSTTQLQYATNVEQLPEPAATTATSTTSTTTLTNPNLLNQANISITPSGNYAISTNNSSFRLPPTISVINDIPPAGSTTTTTTVPTQTTVNDIMVIGTELNRKGKADNAALTTVQAMRAATSNTTTATASTASTPTTGNVDTSRKRKATNDANPKPLKNRKISETAFA